MPTIYFVIGFLAGDHNRSLELYAEQVCQLGQKYLSHATKTLNSYEFLELCAEHKVSKSDIIIVMDYYYFHLLLWD